MKKFFSFILLMSASFASVAQGVSFTLNTAPCNANGVVTANFTGLTAPVTVTWNVLGSGTVTHTGVTTFDIYTGYTGAYMYVTAVDANNITAYGNYEAPAFNVHDTTTAAVCPGLGTATANVTGGTGPYTYSWYNPVTNVVVGTSNPISLPGGQIGLMVTDANGCVWNSNYFGDSIAVSVTSNINYSVTGTPASCTNGTLLVSGIYGGVAPYSYLWSTGATSTNISGLTLGIYYVTVTDALGCSAQRYGYVSQTPQIGVNITPTPATCLQNNGAAIAFGSGGASPYSYSWANGATTQSITNVTAGSYAVHVTDVNGCIGNGTANVTASTPITVTQAATPSSCTAATGSATLTLAGGLAPYTVQWSTSPAQTGVTASNLAAGTYAFHVTDANGCVRNGSVSVPPINVISVGFSATNAVCTQANGSLIAYPSGGALPYTYLWSNGATTQTDNSLAAGYYNVTITDNVGCSVNKQHQVPYFSPVNINLSSVPATCIFNTDGSITANVYGGTTPYTYSWSNGQSTATATGLGAGSYNISVTDAAGCLASDYTQLGYNASNNSCYCTITGTVYDDVNVNCTQDAGDAGLQNIQLHCSGRGYTYTDANGHYSFIVPSGTYTITQTVLGFYPLASCQANGIVVTATASAGCTNTVDFANTVSPIHDMHISTWDYNLPIPGHTYNQACIVSNEGTVSEPGAIGGYNTDGQLGAASFSPSGIFTGAGNQYGFAAGGLTLSPGASQLFGVDYAVPGNIPLNTSVLFKDSVAYTSPMSNWLNDYSPWNNVNYFNTITVASYDPNFKEVLPQGEGPTGIISYADSTLEYMVHFQNTGTYMAENVVVVDTLDQNLDWTSLRPIYQSKPCKVTMSENGAATFTFSGINLPTEASDEQGSNAMFTYTVKTKPNLPLGTQFKNSASIYFDYNAPVKTNSTLNTLGNPTGVAPVVAGANAFSVYPNPAANTFNAAINSEGESANAVMNVCDIAGRVLITKSLSLHKGTQVVSVDVNRLTPGIYLVNLAQDNKVQTQKLVIMK